MTEDAIPASTLIVVRDRPNGRPELLMVERSESMAFAAGALVFPGGRIDPADRQVADELGLDEGGVVAAIRETIEETAVPVGLMPVPDQADALRMQADLHAELGLRTLLDNLELSIDTDALTPFARWVPKFHAVRRFDTIFYVARSPDGDWLPNALAGECTGAFWMSAQEVLEREMKGEARLIFPTRRNLERLAQHASFDDIRADAVAHPIEPVTPWVEERGGVSFVTIPGHLGYPVTEERLDGLWRG